MFSAGSIPVVCSLLFFIEVLIFPCDTLQYNIFTQAAISYGMQAKRVLSKEGLVEDLEKIVQVYEISQKK